MSVIGQIAVAQSLTDEWAAFLRTRNTESYHVLAQGLYSCQASQCLQDAAPSSVVLNKLLTLVQQGDPMAVDLTFLSIRLLDGGNLEDAMRALSALTGSNPKLFLKQIKKQSMSDRQIKRLLHMLPLDSVDDIDKKKLILDQRIRALSAVDDPSLIDLRDLAIAKLRLMRIEFK